MLINFFNKLLLHTQSIIYKKPKAICIVVGTFKKLLTFKVKITNLWSYKIKSFNYVFPGPILFFYDTFSKKFVKVVFIFFELELFFLSHDIFIFIFFIYSLFNRVLLVFMFVFLCIKISEKLHTCIKVFAHLTYTTYLSHLMLSALA